MRRFRGAEPEEFLAAGPVLGGQFGEPALDALPVLAVSVRVTGGLLVFELGDEIRPAALDVGDQLLQLTAPRHGRAVGSAGGAGSVLGQLGAEQLVPGGPEDPLGEERMNQLQQDVLADPEAGRVIGVPACPFVVVTVIGLAGVVGILAARLAEHAPAAQIAEHVRAQLVGPARLRVAVRARAGA